MAEQLQCKHKHKHVRRNNEGGCHETSHEIHEFRIHSNFIYLLHFLGRVCYVLYKNA